MEILIKNAVLGLLRPMVRYLIQQGFTYPVVCDWLKRVYVDEAFRAHRTDVEPPTNSRVSLLTGVHRKEVRRLREAQTDPMAELEARAEAGLAVRVVSEWVTNPRYLNAHRKPRRLPLRAPGTRPSFENLVKSVKADMRPAAVLDELVRASVATIEDDHVVLLRNAYISQVPADKLAYLGINVGDHLRSVLHNIADHGEPFIERAVYYGLVEADQIGKLRPEIFQHAEHLLREVNVLVKPLNDAAVKKPVADGRRVRLGVYYFEESPDDADPETQRYHETGKQR